MSVYFGQRCAYVIVSGWVKIIFWPMGISGENYPANIKSLLVCFYLKREFRENGRNNKVRRQK